MPAQWGNQFRVCVHFTLHLESFSLLNQAKDKIIVNFTSHFYILHPRIGLIVRRFKKFTQNVFFFQLCCKSSQNNQIAVQLFYNL